MVVSPFPSNPIRSMYGIFTYIYHRNQPNVGKHTIHGSYGNKDCCLEFQVGATLQFHDSTDSSLHQTFRIQIRLASQETGASTVVVKVQQGDFLTQKKTPRTQMGPLASFGTSAWFFVGLSFRNRNHLGYRNLITHWGRGWIFGVCCFNMF